jgi:hypothetical protein
VEEFTGAVGLRALGFGPRAIDVLDPEVEFRTELRCGCRHSPTLPDAPKLTPDLLERINALPDGNRSGDHDLLEIIWKLI